MACVNISEDDSSSNVEFSFSLIKMQIDILRRQVIERILEPFRDGQSGRDEK